MARGIGDERDRAGALAPRRASPLGAPGQMEEARRVARGIGSEWDRAKALAAPVRLTGALDRWRKRGGGAGDLGMSGIGPCVRGLLTGAWGEWEECGGGAGDLGRAGSGRRVGGAGRPRPGGAGQVEEALAVARGSGPSRGSAGALAALAPYLGCAGQVEEVLAVVRGIGDEQDRAVALAALCPGWGCWDRWRKRGRRARGDRDERGIGALCVAALAVEGFR